MILKPSPLSSRHFHYIPAKNMLVAEMSDFGRSFDFGRVYDDACDIGLTIRSERTGREIVFAVEHIERDREGDLLYWTLRPVNRNEWAAGTVRIYND